MVSIRFTGLATPHVLTCIILQGGILVLLMRVCKARQDDERRFNDRLGVVGDEFAFGESSIDLRINRVLSIADGGELGG